MLPGLLGVMIGLLLTGFGVSSLLSGAFVFPVPAPGDNPFKARPGGGFSLLLSTFVSWGALGVLVLPELVLAIVGFVTGELGYGIAAIVVGLILGTVFLVLGVRLGGRILDRRGPELLTSMRAQR
jgi:ABC-2 type transport system permease protein